MGFPSPAADYAESRLSLDGMLGLSRTATYFMRAGATSWRHGIQQGAILVIDSGRRPCSGSLVVCQLRGEFHVRVLRLNPAPRLEHLDSPDRWDSVPSYDDGAAGTDDGIFGVIRYIINNATDGEFDDVPVI
ncbi:hypothetical protein TUM12370_24170 [Salmonella enterica subsp. enterica serovar Choleraesuis]|nr:hypothetical protein TUM12370_24170 [Salmonella enterica subsp. enterica serovar Choleraesuis]